MDIRYKQGQDEGDKWRKFFVKGLEEWERQDNLSEYSCDAPDGTVFTIFEQSGNKENIKTFKFGIAVVADQFTELEIEEGGGYCKGSFTIICQGYTKVKAPRLIQWWEEYKGDHTKEFALHCAANIDKKGVTECPHFEPTEEAIAELVEEINNEDAIGPDVKIEEIINEEAIAQKITRTWINPKTVVLDADTQSRKASEAKIEEYAEIMKDELWKWDNFPMIVVYDDGISRYPSDGHHRVAAAILAEQESIYVELRSGSLRDAIWTSFSSNKYHGLAITNEDKRLRVDRILRDQEWQKMSDVLISDHCGVSRKLISKVRIELTGTGSVAPAIERIGKDGRVQKIQRIGKSTNKEKVKSEEISDRLIEAQEIIGDPEAIAKGYLTEEMIDLAMQLSSEVMGRNLPRHGSVGTPYKYWIDKSEIYKEADKKYKSKQMLYFEKLCDRYISLLTPLEIIPKNDVLVEMEEAINDPQAIAKGYLNAEIMEMAMRLANEVVRKNLVRVNVGNPVQYWLKNSEVYKEADSRLKTGQMTVFQKVCDQHISAIPTIDRLEELLKMQELLSDPEAIAKGYLLEEMLDMGVKLAEEVISKNLIRSGSVGNPFEYWIKNSEVYQEAHKQFKTRALETFDRVCDYYLSLMPRMDERIDTEIVEIIKDFAPEDADTTLIAAPRTIEIINAEIEEEILKLMDKYGTVEFGDAIQRVKKYSLLAC